ncbi:unnamed protein product [Coregonus sp. 'balchen']|nr:unnamed protein product [Coregonus sp. 'balchen']
MSADCTSYYNAEKVLVNEFTCPKPDSDARALFCCGFNDMKYCCDDPNSFFPYEYGYMWWLSPREGPSQSHPSSAPTGPQGFKKHFLSGKLDCDNQPPDPDRLFQRCFMATVTTINVEGSS